MIFQDILLATDAHLGNCRLQQGGPGLSWVIPNEHQRMQMDILRHFRDIHICTHALVSAWYEFRRCGQRIKVCTHVSEFGLAKWHPFDAHVCTCFLLFHPLTPKTSSWILYGTALLTNSCLVDSMKNGTRTCFYDKINPYQWLFTLG